MHKAIITIKYEIIQISKVRIMQVTHLHNLMLMHYDNNNVDFAKQLNLYFTKIIQME